MKVTSSHILFTEHILYYKKWLLKAYFFFHYVFATLFAAPQAHTITINEYTVTFDSILKSLSYIWQVANMKEELICCEKIGNTRITS